jgi:hypothetical protein
MLILNDVNSFALIRFCRIRSKGLAFRQMVPSARYLGFEGGWALAAQELLQGLQFGFGHV